MPQEDSPPPENLAPRSPDGLRPSRWNDHIPGSVQEEMSQAVWEQVVNLPVNLFVEWFTPKFLERRWFVEASAYIFIPYPEHWKEPMSQEPEIHRPTETLPPFSELLRDAEVSSESVQQAVEDWKEKPSDSNFTEIFEAEPEDYQPET